jgi:hypothetical protein
MTTQAKSNYPYSTLHKEISFYHSHSNDPHQRYHFESSSSHLQSQESNTSVIERVTKGFLL